MLKFLHILIKNRHKHDLDWNRMSLPIHINSSSFSLWGLNVPASSFGLTVKEIASDTHMPESQVIGALQRNSDRVIHRVGPDGKMTYGNIENRVTAGMLATSKRWSRLTPWKHGVGPELMGPA